MIDAEGVRGPGEDFDYTVEGWKLVACRANLAH